MAAPNIKFKVLRGDGAIENGNSGSDPTLVWQHNLSIANPTTNTTVTVHRITLNGVNSMPVLLAYPDVSVVSDTDKVEVTFDHDCDNYEAYMITLTYN